MVWVTVFTAVVTTAAMLLDFILVGIVAKTVKNPDMHVYYSDAVSISIAVPLFSVVRRNV